MPEIWLFYHLKKKVKAISRHTDDILEWMCISCFEVFACWSWTNLNDAISFSSSKSNLDFQVKSLIIYIYLVEKKNPNFLNFFYFGDWFV